MQSEFPLYFKSMLLSFGPRGSWHFTGGYFFLPFARQKVKRDDNEAKEESDQDEPMKKEEHDSDDEEPDNKASTKEEESDLRDIRYRLEILCCTKWWITN